MTPQRWSQIKGVFNGALERPAGERSAWLRSECGSDAALLAAAEQLLHSHDTLGGFLERPLEVDPEDLALASAPDAVDESAIWHTGDRVGEFEIIRQIGRGGMGVVYLATDRRLHRNVALKSLPSALANNTDLRERLKREARAAATITDSAVATVYSLEEVEGHLLLASEFIDGSTLRAVMDNGPMEVATVHAAALQIAQGLRAAHEAGVVHRDLKPENILLPPGGAKIVDFGIAWLDGPGLSRHTKLTRAGAMIGTPAYMAPEQLMGQQVDARTDIYAFGVLLAEMLSGRHPLSVSDAAPVERERSPEHEVLAGLLQRVADHCRQTAPAQRVQSARELVAMLEGLAGAADGSAPAVPRSATTARRRSRFWWEFHQAAAAVSYGAMLVPAWLARGEIGSIEGRGFFIATTCAAVVAAMLRLHLWFTSREHPADLVWARRRSAPWIRLADVLLVVSLVIGAGLVAAQSALDIVLLVLAVGAAVAFIVIEPSTARAAGLDDRGGRL
ncbi:MAG TPA: serine/threonine-protein kinase [Vicinamibacterales bacterium]|nr:serine/threonine-protein kinase [Vicinamibacterales bacterium]